MTYTKTGIQITQVATVIVPVGDPDRAIDFYVETLGFEKRADIPFGEGDRWVEGAARGSATTIALVAARQGDPLGSRHVWSSRSTIDADHAALRAQGVDVDEAVMRMESPVPPMFFFRDRDGNGHGVVKRG